MNWQNGEWIIERLYTGNREIFPFNLFEILLQIEDIELMFKKQILPKAVLDSKFKRVTCRNEGIVVLETYWTIKKLRQLRDIR